jgi:hypothetical protein
MRRALLLHAAAAAANLCFCSPRRTMTGDTFFWVFLNKDSFALVGNQALT